MKKMSENEDADLKVALYQCNIKWEDCEKNCVRYHEVIDSFLESSDFRPDIIVFPEMFASGFTMNKNMAEKSVTALQWMKDLAAEYNVALTGSLPFEEDGRYYNRLFFVTDKYAYHYDKRHLFRMSGEEDVYSPGKEKLVVDYRGFRIAFNICYDLRFPVWSRNKEGYDLMINVASWPRQRIHVAENLAVSRAIENLSYFIFCNRTGNGPVEKYNGHSMIVDFKGNIVGEKMAVPGMKRGECFIYAALHKAGLVKFRTKFPAHRDADKFLLKIK